jgi:hypothetical protein
MRLRGGLRASIPTFGNVAIFQEPRIIFGDHQNSVPGKREYCTTYDCITADDKNGTPRLPL